MRKSTARLKWIRINFCLTILYCCVNLKIAYKECVRDKLDDRTTTCLTVRCQCLNDGLYITPVVPTGVFYALFIVEIIILKEIFYENT